MPSYTHTRPPGRSPPGLFARCFLLQLADAAASPSPAELSSAVALLKLPRNAKGTAETQKRVEVWGELGGGEGGLEQRGGGGRRRKVGRADLKHAIYSESYQKSDSPIWFSSGCRMPQEGCLPCADLFNFTLKIIH